MAYDPPRKASPGPDGADPLEVELVFGVRPCGTCGFFWPADPADQPYGPYSTWDFAAYPPVTAEPPDASGKPFAWTACVTRPAGFPDAEVADGCRKAPIMTIGINPNLTAFGGGKASTAWCYPSFADSQGVDSYTKYAFYYRYRSLFQESLGFEFARQFLVEAQALRAPRPGTLQSIIRTSDSPNYTIGVIYDGDTAVTTIPLYGHLGAPPMMVVIDKGAAFAAGNILAAPIALPSGQATEVFANTVGYYARMTPILADFSAFLQRHGHAGAALAVGEDVCQLDMVGCASPHWGPAWLGGARAQSEIVANCVSRNGWALKQLIQTQPALLIIVSHDAFEMFHNAFAHLFAAPIAPPDGSIDPSFDLLRATTHPHSPVRLNVETMVDGQAYRLSTRVVVTPHFSYGEYFLPQYRFSQQDWATFGAQFPDAARFLQTDIRPQASSSTPGLVAFQIKDPATADAVEADLATNPPVALATLQEHFYDANAAVEAILEEMYSAGELNWTQGAATEKGYLARNAGPCSFCVNSHWQFPAGCPYDKLPKPTDPPLPAQFLQRVARQCLGQPPENPGHK
ncbi:hypothetical protein [Paraburkholderia fungorum]|uniref:hypothetical protein n=1 Tax=Paraburkholderia fungorum TaxID=134537 RepID=UPI0038B7E924